MTTKKNPVPGLDRFEDDDVLQSTIALKNAGDGLSKPLAVKPVQIHDQQEVYLVMRTTCTGIAHKRLTDKQVKDIRLPDGTPLPAGSQGMNRKQDLTPDIVTIVDGQVVAEMLDRQRQLNAEHDGTPELPLDGERDADD